MLNINNTSIFKQTTEPPKEIVGFLLKNAFNCNIGAVRDISPIGDESI